MEMGEGAWALAEGDWGRAGREVDEPNGWIHLGREGLLGPLPKVGQGGWLLACLSSAWVLRHHRCCCSGDLGCDSLCRPSALSLSPTIRGCME